MKITLKTIFSLAAATMFLIALIALCVYFSSLGAWSPSIGALKTALVFIVLGGITTAAATIDLFDNIKITNKE